MDENLKNTMRKFRGFAYTAPGLSGALHSELTKLLPTHSFRNTDEGCEMVITEEDMWKLCGTARVAAGIRVRLGDPKPVIKFPVFDRYLGSLPWSQLLPIEQPIIPKVNVTCHTSKLFHSDALAERVVDFLTKKKFLAKKAAAEGFPFNIYVRLVDDTLNVSVDVSGDFLFKRGYRTHISSAPIRENLVAGCLEIMKYNGYLRCFLFFVCFYSFFISSCQGASLGSILRKWNHSCRSAACPRCQTLRLQLVGESAD